jgi:hypothetical protein
LVFASIGLIRPCLAAAPHHAKPKGQQSIWLLFVSEKGMAKSRRGTVLDPLWLKCFRGVADAPQIFTFS